LQFKLMALCHSQVTLMLSTDINITETTYSCQFPPVTPCIFNRNGWLDVEISSSVLYGNTLRRNLWSP